MRARLFRLATSAATIVALAASLGAGVKWR